MTTQVTKRPPTHGDRMFDRGVLSGISWFQQCDTPNVPPLAATIVKFTKENMIDLALEGNLTEELLRQDVGIVVGFVLGHLTVFKILDGEN